MASIHTEIRLGADPVTAWDAVRDFANVHERVAAGFVTATRLEGGDRIVTFVTGAEARERLVDVDEGRRRLVYSVIESPLGLSHHQASVEVLDGSDGGSRLVWIADLLPDQAAPTIEAMMTQGASAIARTLAG
jgi:Polyketide cyclase / dehydrase and lipid transport